MKIKEILAKLELYAPLRLQETYDNCGLLVGDRDSEVHGVLCTLDITEEVIKEAVELGANLIVAHHPVIFSGLKTITGKNYTERIVIQAIQQNIALYAAHTNLDNIDTGVNKVICDKLKLQNCQILEPMQGQLVKLVTFVPENYAQKVREALFETGAGHIGNYNSCSFSLSGNGTFRGNENSKPFVGTKGDLHNEPEVRIETIVPRHILSNALTILKLVHPYEEVAYDIYTVENANPLIGAGMIGYLSEPVSSSEFLSLLKEIFNIHCVRFAGNDKQEIHKVAVCGGSGSFLIAKVIRSGANAFVTGDIKYHQFFDAEQQILLCDVGHYESEQFTKEIFYSLLIKNFSTFAVHLSRVITNPIKYYL